AIGAPVIVNVDGNGPSRAFYGIGLVNSSGTSKLLQDYPAAQQSDILDLLFKPKFGASLQLVKNEIGADSNSSSGTEPSHWRNPSDTPSARGVNFWIAREAKARNPAMQFAALRWATPAWVKDDEAKCKYLTTFLDLMSANGTPVDFIGPGINEDDYTAPLGAFIKNTFKPALDAGGYTSKIVIADDIKKPWSAAPAVNKDATLKDAVFALSAHYTDASDSAAKSSGLPLFNAESDTGMMDWTRGIWVARRIATALSAGKQSMWLFQPALDCVYENIRYQRKGILTANAPWSGHYEVSPDLWLTAQFTQFADVGWRILDGGSGAVDGDNAYVTFKDPRSGAYSIVIVNGGPRDVTYTFNTANLSDAALHVWTTDEQAQFVRKPSITPQKNAFNVTVPARSVYSLTTTQGQQKGQPARAIPSPQNLALPYADNFSTGYATGDQPRYFHDQNGAFEIVDDSTGGRVLQQVITTVPSCWWQGNSQPPFTVMGGLEFANYTVDVDIKIPDASASAGVAARLSQVNPMATARTQPEGYSLLLDGAGHWVLKKSTGAAVTVLSSGTLADYDNSRWHHLKIAVNGQTIAGYLDGTQLATVTDDTFTSGNIALATDTTDKNAWPNVLFKNLRIEAINPATPAFVKQKDDGDREVFSYSADGWKHVGGVSASQTDFKRTHSSAEKAGATLEFSFSGAQVSLVGVKNKTGGKADVFIDDVLRATINTTAPVTQNRNALFS
ncbi:MAG TPA: family 16 glycoside hydrolase, partial [Roseimicrobium sp.]|nr:family 16 glycoside hydrolase [Roseimicrobium sp.]